MFAVCLIYFFKSGFAYFLQVCLFFSMFSTSNVVLIFTNLLMMLIQLKELFSILTAMKSGVCMFQGFGCCGSSRRRDNYSCKIVISFSRQAMGCCIKNEFCGKSWVLYTGMISTFFFGAFYRCFIAFVSLVYCYMSRFACYRQTYALISSRLFRDFQDVHTSII